jgi:hypothetical protein
LLASRRLGGEWGGSLLAAVRWGRNRRVGTAVGDAPAGRAHDR